MNTLRIITNGAAGTALIASSLLVAPALATPGSGFTPTEIVSGHFGTIQENTAGDKTGKWGMILKTLDDSDVGTGRLTIQPGGFSGWHAHPQSIFVTVKQGCIVWFNGSDPLCPSQTYNAGDSFVEHAYVIHNVRNASTTEPAEFFATSIRPTGAPGRLDRPAPNNCNF